MRLVFVQHGGTHVCGSWPAHNHCIDDDVEEMAIAAIRQLCESIGSPRCSYEFLSFGPKGPNGGYDVFCCPDDEARHADVADEEFAAVVCSCQYVGHVRPLLSLPWLRPSAPGCSVIASKEARNV
jgi:hypothetical protein